MQFVEGARHSYEKLSYLYIEKEFLTVYLWNIY